jgi:hypothetical protein
MTLKYTVPSWNFCNKDVFTSNGLTSQERCRFCVKTRKGYYCTLHDMYLTSDKEFTYKTKVCIDATAGFAITVDEPQTPTVDPKLIIKETVKTYNKILSDLMNTGYPRNIAEKVAMEYVLGDK